MDRVLAVLAAIPWAELAHAAIIIAGWALVTWGVAELLVWQVWPLSAGVFLLSLAGWKHLGVVFGDGLYVLTRDPSTKRKAGRR